MSHADELFSVLIDPALYQYLDETPPASPQHLRKKLARSEGRKSPDGSEHWLNWVVRDESGRMAGYVQTTIKANHEAHIAYVIGSTFWGRGLAQSAVRQMLDGVANDFGVTHFFVNAEQDNWRSIALAKRLGFVEVAPEVHTRQGATHTEVVLERVLAPFTPMHKP